MKLINLAIPDKKRTEHFASSGCKTKTVYKYVYNEAYACPRRVANGQINVDDMIQQYADDVDFVQLGKMLVANKENVVDHFALNGEVQDVTGLPRNIHEYEYLHNKIKEEYEKMPDELKNLFGSFEGFRSSWTSGTIGGVLDTYYKSLQAPVEEKKEGNE